VHAEQRAEALRGGQDHQIEQEDGPHEDEAVERQALERVAPQFLVVHEEHERLVEGQRVAHPREERAKMACHLVVPEDGQKTFGLLC
jgi:hypothetical protein